MPAQHRVNLADRHLAPDFKTIADFRKDNGKAIREVCRAFVAVARQLELLSAASVAIDGSKFKAVNARDKNFSPAKMKRRLERIDESIARYMAQLETADRRGDAVPEAKVARLKDKIAKLKEEIVRLNAINVEMMKAEDKQISLTDPDARSMATSGRGTGIVGYNVQSAVETEHHLIVAHEVVMTSAPIGINSPNMAGQAEVRWAWMSSRSCRRPRLLLRANEIRGLRGHGGHPRPLPKPLTSGAKAAGRFGKQDFVYLPDEDVYRCPAGGARFSALRARGADPPLLDERLSDMCAQSKMHDRPGAACLGGNTRLSSMPYRHDLIATPTK